MYAPVSRPAREARRLTFELEDFDKEFAMAAHRSSDPKLLELELFFEQAPVPMCILIGPDHVFTVANSLYKEFIGRNPIGQAVRDVFTEEEAGTFFELLDGVFRTGVPYIGKELPFRRPVSGKVQDFRINIGYHPFKDSEGKIKGVLAFVQDVTELVLAREAVENQRTWLEKTMDRLPTPLFLFDPKSGHATFMNQAAQGLLKSRYVGMSVTERYGKSIIASEVDGRVLGPHEVPSARIARGEHLSNEEVILRSPAGRFHLSATSEFLPAEYGHEATILLLLKDLTATKDAEAAVRESEAQFRTLADSMPQMVFVADAQGAITYFNKRWYEYIARSEPGTEGWGWAGESIHHPDDLQRTIATWKESLATGKPYEVEYRLKRGSDGMYRWHLGRAIPIRDENGNIVRWYGTNTDIHEYKMLLDTLAQTREMAEKANAAKSVFLANMSHEIRTPLGAILGFVNLLKQPNVAEADRERYIDVIDRNTGQLLRIVDDILDLSKVEAGKLVVENIRFSLTELLADFSSLMGFKARENGIDFQIKGATPLPEFINSDPTRVRQILTNVVGNAIKFTERGRVELTVSFREPRLEFKVADTGCGISKEQSQTLFQPFTQADASMTRKFGGTGLGLALTKRLSEILGGEFRLESSEVGKGSVFVSSIRVETPPDVKFVDLTNVFLNEPAPAAMLENPRSLENMKILLVEDSPDNQVLMKVVLGKLGAQVEVAPNGLKGIEAALSNDVDVVLMDVQMPIMDGHEATRKLRAKGFKKPIIALTAHAMKEERERANASGFTDFLSKPINRGQLTEVLLRYRRE